MQYAKEGKKTMEEVLGVLFSAAWIFTSFTSSAQKLSKHTDYCLSGGVEEFVEKLSAGDNEATNCPSVNRDTGILSCCMM